MKQKMILLVVALAAAWVVSPAQTQDSKYPAEPSTARYGDPTSIARQYQDYLYGVVKSLNENELVLTKTKFGTDQTLKLNKKTKYVQNGKSSSPDKISKGDRVWVDVEKDKKTGDMIAKKVVSGVDLPAGP
jgi:hypothetical protein